MLRLRPATTLQEASDALRAVPVGGFSWDASLASSARTEAALDELTDFLTKLARTPGTDPPHPSRTPAPACARLPAAPGPAAAAARPPANLGSAAKH